MLLVSKTWLRIKLIHMNVPYQSSYDMSLSAMCPCYCVPSISIGASLLWNKFPVYHCFYFLPGTQMYPRNAAFIYLETAKLATWPLLSKTSVSILHVSDITSGSSRWSCIFSLSFIERGQSSCYKHKYNTNWCSTPLHLSFLYLVLGLQLESTTLSLRA